MFSLKMLISKKKKDKHEWVKQLNSDNRKGAKEKPQINEGWKKYGSEKNKIEST